MANRYINDLYNNSELLFMGNAALNQAAGRDLGLFLRFGLRDTHSLSQEQISQMVFNKAYDHDCGKKLEDFSGRAQHIVNSSLSNFMSNLLKQRNQTQQQYTQRPVFKIHKRTLNV